MTTNPPCPTCPDRSRAKPVKRVVARRWTAGARIVTTAEWVGIDVDDDDKPAWVQQFTAPSLPKVTQPLCPTCPDRSQANPVTQEIEGRVLVCDECAEDQALRDHARDYW